MLAGYNTYKGIEKDRTVLILVNKSTRLTYTKRNTNTVVYYKMDS